MERRRPSLIGPLILITLGVLFLLANLGYLPLSFWEIAFRFWPLILILIGLEIILGRSSMLGALAVLVLWVALVGGILWLSFSQGSTFFNTAAAVTEQLNQPLGEIKSATIDLNVGIATTTVNALGSDTTDLMKGTFGHNQGVRIVKTYNVAGGDGRLSLKEEGFNPMFWGNFSSRWDIGLNSQIPLALRVNGGVGRTNLDLSGLMVTSFDVDTGVGTVEMTMPKIGTTSARINGGVGNARITIPQEVAARIRVNRGLGSIRIDESRFPKSGDTYQSADYAGASNKIDIEIDGGIGSINIQ